MLMDLNESLHARGENKMLIRLTTKGSTSTGTHEGYHLLTPTRQWLVRMSQAN